MWSSLISNVFLMIIGKVELPVELSRIDFLEESVAPTDFVRFPFRNTPKLNWV